VAGLAGRRLLCRPLQSTGGARLAGGVRVIRRWPGTEATSLPTANLAQGHSCTPQVPIASQCLSRPVLRCQAMPLPPDVHARATSILHRPRANAYMHIWRHIRVAACHTTLNRPRIACSDAGTSALREPARTRKPATTARGRRRLPPCGLASPADSLRGPAGAGGGRRRCAARRCLAAAHGSP